MFNNIMHTGREQPSASVAKPDKLKTVFNNVKVSHAEFLTCDVLKEKPIALKKLKGCINEYLNCVPHSCKFRFSETERVLSRSVSSIADFDPLDASRAFENFALYAHNLLEQPWRKDFTRIKLNSGFFTHNISAHLEKSEEILEIIGYVHTDDDDKILILPSQADNQVLAAVSLDCYVASQECLLLSRVWTNVQKVIPEYPLVIFEAYQVRKKRVGNMEFVVKCLVQEAHERSRNSHVPVDTLIEVDADDSVFVHPPSPSDQNCTIEYNRVDESFAELLADSSQIMDMNFPSSRLAPTIVPSPSSVAHYAKGVDGVSNPSRIQPATPIPSLQAEGSSLFHTLATERIKDSTSTRLNGKTRTTRFNSPPAVLPPTPMSRNGGPTSGVGTENLNKRPNNIPRPTHPDSAGSITLSDRPSHFTKPPPVSALKGAKPRPDLSKPTSNQIPQNFNQPSRFHDPLNTMNNGVSASILRNPDVPASVTFANQMAGLGMVALKSSALTISKVASQTDIPSLLEDAMMPTEEYSRAKESTVNPDTMRNNFIYTTDNQKGDKSKDIGLSRPVASQIPPWSCPRCTFLNRINETKCEMCEADNNILVDLGDFSADGGDVGPNIEEDGEDCTDDREASGDWTLVEVGRKTKAVAVPRNVNAERKKVLPPEPPRTIATLSIKSRNGTGATKQEILVSGNKNGPRLAKHCPKCTLLNDVRNVCCDACGEIFFLDE